MHLKLINDLENVQNIEYKNTPTHTVSAILIPWSLTRPINH